MVLQCVADDIEAMSRASWPLSHLQGRLKCLGPEASLGVNSSLALSTVALAITFPLVTATEDGLGVLGVPGLQPSSPSSKSRGHLP